MGIPCCRAAAITQSGSLSEAADAAVQMGFMSLKVTDVSDGKAKICKRFVRYSLHYLLPLKWTHLVDRGFLDTPFATIFPRFVMLSYNPLVRHYR